MPAIPHLIDVGSVSYTCRISGLSVRAEMELPGVMPAVVAEGSEDVHIRLRSLPEQLESVAMRGPVWELDKSHFLLRLPGIGKFLASDGTTLDMDPEPGTDPADALPFLLGTGLGALLLQRGALVLHASAVALDGRAYIFCGRSGIGKSTLAAALCQMGCTFLNDDICAIESDSEGRPAVSPDSRCLKLCAESIEHLDLEVRRKGVVRSGIDKHFVDPPSSGRGGPARVAAIYILRDQTPSDALGIKPLPALAGAQTLLQQSYRPRLALAFARGSRQVALTAAILRHAGIFELTRSRDLRKLEGTAEELRAHWRSLAE